MSRVFNTDRRVEIEKIKAEFSNRRNAYLDAFETERKGTHTVERLLELTYKSIDAFNPTELFQDACDINFVSQLRYQFYPEFKTLLKNMDDQIKHPKEHFDKYQIALLHNEELVKILTLALLIGKDYPLHTKQPNVSKRISALYKQGFLEVATAESDRMFSPTHLCDRFFEHLLKFTGRSIIIYHEMNFLTQEEIEKVGLTEVLKTFMHAFLSESGVPRFVVNYQNYIRLNLVIIYADYEPLRNHEIYPALKLVAEKIKFFKVSKQSDEDKRVLSHMGGIGSDLMLAKAMAMESTELLEAIRVLLSNGFRVTASFDWDNGNHVPVIMGTYRKEIDVCLIVDTINDIIESAKT